METKILNSLKPYQSNIKGFDLAKYIYKSMPSTKEEHDHISTILEKAKTDVVTDGKRLLTISRSGGPNSHYDYSLLILKF